MSEERIAIHTFSLTFRDKSHFNKVICWLNTNVGHGKDKWTTSGRILRHLKQNHYHV